MGGVGERITGKRNKRWRSREKDAGKREREG